MVTAIKHERHSLPKDGADNTATDPGILVLFDVIVGIKDSSIIHWVINRVDLGSRCNEPITEGDSTIHLIGLLPNFDSTPKAMPIIFNRINCQ
jgi:hypothetical protein